MKTLPKLCLTIFSLILIFNVSAKAQSALNEILKRMDLHQKALTSLQSKMTMEKYNVQLNETDRYEGTAAYLRRPKNQLAIRIDWTKPSLESLYLMNDQYVLYTPRLKQAIIGSNISAKKTDQNIAPLAFLSMSKAQLKAAYNITYFGQEKIQDKTETWHLGFTPKAKDVYKTAEFWVNGEGMPIQLKVTEFNGDTSTVLLYDFTRNQNISVRRFQPLLPKDIKLISDGGSGGGNACFKPIDTNDALTNWSDAVFSGKVVSVKGSDYTFKAEIVWKGKIEPKTIVRSADWQISQIPKLTVGESYVVFAQNRLVTDVPPLFLPPCSYTTTLKTDYGKKVLKELGKGAPVKKSPAKKPKSVIPKSKRK